MSQEVKVTIEWNGNTVGLHPDPMTVHIAGEADPHKVIEAVTEAMGIKGDPKLFKSGDDEYAHVVCGEDDKISVFFPNGEIRSFPTWHEALDYIADKDDETTAYIGQQGCEGLI